MRSASPRTCFVITAAGKGLSVSNRERANTKTDARSSMQVGVAVGVAADAEPQPLLHPVILMMSRPLRVCTHNRDISQLRMWHVIAQWSTSADVRPAALRRRQGAVLVSIAVCGEGVVCLLTT